MKTLFNTKPVITFAMILSLFVNLGGANIGYRQAKINDIKDFCSLYDTMDEKAKQRLVIFPKQIRTNIISSNIKDGKFFVAYDKDNKNTIVAFTKLYTIENKEDLVGILKDELRCIGNNAKLEEAYLYSFKKADNFFKANLSQSTIKHSFQPRKQSLFLYYGGAYTHPDYRGKRINSTLQQYAYNQVLKNINFKKLKTIILGYGQVTANKVNTAPIKVFANNMKQLCHKKTLLIRHYCYKAYMPDFVFTNKKLAVLPDNEKNRGQGNILEFDLR